MSFSKDEPLSQKEQEEEEMRNELANYDIKDDDLSMEDMRILLRTLKESEKDSKKENHSVDHKLPESNKGQPTKPEKHGNSSTNSQTNHWNNFKNDNESVPLPEDQSKETLESYYVKNFTSKSEVDNGLDKELTNEKHHTINSSDFPPLGSTSHFKNVSDSPKQLSKDNKKSAAAIKKMRLEKYKLNPFNFEQNKDAPPLQTNQQFCEPNNSSYFVENLDSDQFDAVYNKMTTKLDKLHKIFSSAEMSPEVKNSEWGSPIKVATKWNGSLDKIHNVEKVPTFSYNPKNNCSDSPKVENSSSPGLNVRNTRATKRRAMENFAAYEIENNQSNSDEEFVEFQKKRKTSTKKVADSEKRVQEEQKKNLQNDVIDIDKSGSDTDIFDNTHIHSLRKSNKQESLKIEDSNYPRRVTPPNPNKKFFKGPRSRKKGSNLSASKKKLGLEDEEISKTLEELDKYNNDCVEITEEIKPKAENKTANKLKLASLHLNNIQKNNELQLKKQQEEKKKKENEERLKKDEIVSQRLQERENQESLKNEKERKQMEQGKIYAEIFKKKITKSSFEKQNNADDKNEDLLLADNDDEPEIITTTKSSLSKCPICQKFFSNNQIESHASECDSFSDLIEINNHQPSTSRSSVDEYSCLICNRYKTRDGNLYDEHFVRCKEQSQDRNGTLRI